MHLLRMFVWPVPADCLHMTAHGCDRPDEATPVKDVDQLPSMPVILLNTLQTGGERPEMAILEAL